MTPQAWIEVDPEGLAEVTDKRGSNGIRIMFMPSPYDLPEAFRGFYDSAIDRFAIEFKYLGQERTENELHGEHVTLRLGKNSGRVYGIEIDVNAAQADWVELIQKALTERSKENRKPRRLVNYEATKRLVRARVPALAAASSARLAATAS